MVTKEDLESYLMRMDADFEEVDDGMFLVRSDDEGGPAIVVHHDDPLLLVRLKVMDLPQSDDDGSPSKDESRMCQLFETLLRLNATDVIHGAYGIEEDELILSDTLPLSTLDFEELRASLESVQLAASSHISTIRALANMAGGETE